jgi:hypothetical protein
MMAGKKRKREESVKVEEELEEEETNLMPLEDVVFKGTLESKESSESAELRLDAQL